jgi:hypothetical protein
MQDVFQVLQSDIYKDKPWLILGKGPSFNKRSEYNLSKYYTIGLNHVCREQRVTFAHIIDFDVADTCCEAIDSNAQFLVMPWIPHIKLRPRSQNLRELIQNNPVLRRMDEQHRLLWYNLSTAPRQHGDSPVVPVRYFSAEAALSLLAQAGVQCVRSLGIDGGASYSNAFDDLKDKTLLANGRKSFDKQFEAIAQIIMRTGIDYAPLNVQSPIRVYVGSTEAQMLAVKVLEYSIRKHASMSVDVFPLHRSGIDIPVPKDQRNQSRTPFSFQRFLIPALTGHQGRAIYLDSDMHVLKDIRALWTLPFDGAEVLTVQEPSTSERQPQYSVMLLNCDMLQWDIHAIVKALDEGELNYSQLVYEMALTKNIRASIDPVWNSLERFEADNTALIHYTDMPLQPWISLENPLGYVWMRTLFEAIDQDFIALDFIREHIRQGFVRPSLLYQIEHCIDESFLLPKEARLLDKDFVAPFHTLRKYRISRWIRPNRVLGAATRHYYQKSALFRLQNRIRHKFSK